MQRSNFRTETIAYPSAWHKRRPFLLSVIYGKLSFVGCALLITILFKPSANAQTVLDVSVGTSFQDEYNVQLVARQQFTEKLQVGLELQSGSPRYRFVSAREVIREGYSYTASIPVSFRLASEEKIQLFGIGRLGARFQGIIDPDENDMRDSVLASSALIGELGLASSFQVSEKISLQAGMSVPVVYEISPNTLMEYTWVKLHFGGTWNTSKADLFLHSNIGNAFGASGDTYKYIWSVEAGVRFALGKATKESFQFIQTSF